MVNKAYQGNGKYIFVSYSHKDEKKVYKFIEVLQQKYNVWFDEGIHIGKEWDKEIADKLNECAIFIFCITKNSLESSNCMDEINHAKNKGKTFINLLMDDIELPDNFIFRFSRYQMLNLFEYEDYFDALTVLEKNCDEMVETIKGKDAENVVLQKPKKKKKWIIILSLIILLIGVGAFLTFYFLNNKLSIKPNIESFEDAKIVDNNILYTVPETSSYAALKDKVKVSEGSSWKLYYDEDENIEISSKVASQLNGKLDDGNNIFYLFVYNGKNKKKYILNVHKSHDVNLNYYNNDTLVNIEIIKSGYDYKITYKIEEENKLFNYWLYNDEKIENICILEDSNIYAHFTDKSNSIIYNDKNDNSCEAGNIINNGEFLVCNTNDGYTFVGWYLNNDFVSSDKKIMNNDNYEARWTYYYLNIIDYADNIIFENSNKVSCGKKLILKSNEHDGFKFLGFYIDDILLSNEDNYKFIMPNKNITIYSKYEAENFDLIINNFTDLNIDYVTSYKCGDKVVLSVNNNTSSQLVWKENDDLLFVGNKYEFNMPARNLIIELTLEEIIKEADDGKVLFGRLPQSIVKDEIELNSLNSSYDYENHQDIWDEYDDFKYIKIDINNDNVFDYFGYHSDTTSWYIYEDVKWTLRNFDDGKKYLLSDSIIFGGAFLKDSQSFYENDESFELNYKDSTIRKNINDFLFNLLFEQKEKYLLNEHEVEQDTFDKLFVPSRKEILDHSNYGEENQTAFALNFGYLFNSFHDDFDDPLIMGEDQPFIDGYSSYTRTIEDNKVSLRSSAYYRVSHPAYFEIGTKLACVINF